jgi:phosphoglycolate phosphatase
MNKNLKLIVFDWDGTIADSTRQIVNAVQGAFADLGLPIPTDAASRFIIGLRLDEAIRSLYPSADDALVETLRQRYLHHYLKQDGEIPLFQGMSELLQTLDDAGYFLAVATGKSRKGLERMLDYHCLRHRFHATRTPDEGRPKPYPDMLLFLMDIVGVTPAETLMIGDTTHDIYMAQNANAHSLAVTYGAHSEPLLDQANPTGKATNVAEILAWIKGKV